MINKVVATAVKLFLRSQVERVEDLQVTVTGGNRQILKGYIPEVSLASSCGVYRGLHLRQIELQAGNIGFNVKEVLKRKPLRLLEPILVDVTLLLEAADLQASLSSPLLSSGLTDFLYSLLSAKGITNPREHLTDCQINWETITLTAQKLNLLGTVIDVDEKLTSLNITAGITLANPHTLCLFPLEIVTVPSYSLQDLHKLEIDLGKDVAIAKLLIEDDKLICSGKITVK
jgi:hypothetical protein